MASRTYRSSALTVKFAAVAAVVLGGRAYGVGGGPITTGSLIAELHDMERLTRFPDPPYRLVQFSSYDRRSNLPGGPDWFANDDGFGGEPIPGFEKVLKEPGADGIGEYLICDVQQPGAIVRTWTAAIEGKVGMYLDGAEKPAFDGAADDFFQHKYERYAEAAGLDPKAAGDTFHQQFAEYFPIPFAKSCRIVWVGDVKKLHFYHVNMREYAAGTEVETFKADTLKSLSRTIANTVARIKGDRTPNAGEPSFSHIIDLGPMTKMGLGKYNEANSALCEFSAQIQGATDAAAALRGTVLRMYFDDSPQPQIETPLGDFFGAAPGIAPYDSLPLRVSPGGSMTCRFVMPFANNADITVDNRTNQTFKLAVSGAWRKYDWSDGSMHFHAKWRVNHDLTAKGGKDAIDLPFIIARGKGMYVGTAVYIMNPCPVPTAGGNWWGEGDEKVFVDRDKVPSIFGTGSEDYFNYAWSKPDLFQHPYCAQPICTGPDTRGYITNTRWHILDSIPFEDFLAFYLELYAHTPTPHLSYARMSYWYAEPGAIDDHVPPQDCDLRVPPLPAWKPLAAGGASEATFFEAEDVLSGTTGVEIVEDQRYSGGKLVRWRPETGAALPTLKFHVEAAGKYRVVMTCLSDAKRASFRATLDKAALKHDKDNEAVELFTANSSRLVNVWFEPVELAAGDHILAIDALSGPVGVDFVWIKPVK